MAEFRKTIKRAQQELAQNCGYGNDVIWDLLTPDEVKVMKEKIKQLIPDQKRSQTSIQQLRNTIFNNVWKQRKYTNRTSVTYLFYVMVTKDEDLDTALNSTEFSCHPVFRCKKCDDNSDTSNCCMIYVDERGRVYENWYSFLTENVFPAGTMVTPIKGVYNFKNDEVKLEIHSTPNSKDSVKAINALQTGSAVAGIGASIVPVAALLMPVAAPIVAMATVTGICVGAFSAITSVLNLNDRKKHEQSISPINCEARGSYLGIVAGTIGMASAGATRVMTSMAAAGKATKGIEVLVNGINISSIVLSGSGVANGVLDLIFKYNDGDKVSSLDVLQLSASLVLFTHSVSNFQLASQIANNARDSSIKSYREALSNRQRKSFDKISKETVRIRGSAKGKMDIIRGFNEIPDRQYLNNLYKINKQLNKAKIRPAFGKSGEGIVLNDEVSVKTGVLRQSVQLHQGPNILDQVTRPIPSDHYSHTHRTETHKMASLVYPAQMVHQKNVNSNPLNHANDKHADSESMLRNLVLILPNSVNIFLKDYGNKFTDNVADEEKFRNVLLSMADNLAERTITILMKLAKDFIDTILEEIHQLVNLYIPTESVLYRILKHVLDNYKNLSHDYISEKGEEIKKAVKKYFLSLNCKNRSILPKRCPDCNGNITITQL